MISFIEPLLKSVNEIRFGWAREPGAVSYNIYVGVISTSLSSLVTGIPDIATKASTGLGKVVHVVGIDSVRTVLSLPATTNFGNKVLYFAITYVDSVGSESALADSTIVEVPPVGIISKLMKDDPTINRHGYVFSNELQRWSKMIGSSSGAVIMDTADFYKSNITTEYTYDGTNIETMKSYPSDATAAGSPAKLTTYTFSGSLLTKVVVTDSTV